MAPGAPHRQPLDPDAVVAYLPDGTPLKVGVVQMVYNDWLNIDYIYGPGEYERSNADNPRQLEILAIARELYAAQAHQNGKC